MSRCWRYAEEPEKKLAVLTGFGADGATALHAAQTRPVVEELIRECPDLDRVLDARDKDGRPARRGRRGGTALRVL